MLPRILLMYWGRRVCVLKVVMLLKTNLTQQDTKNFSITSRLGRVFKKKNFPSLFEILNLLLSYYISFIIRNITTFNMHTLLPIT